VTDTKTKPMSRRSLAELVTALPGLVTQLIRDEVERLKHDLTAGLAKIGVGIGLFVGAALFAFFALATLIAAAVLGLATVLAPWLSALIIGVALLALAAILALIGKNSLQKGIPPVPEESIDSLKRDLNVVKGLGR
jgi:hypothetical protein